MAADRAAELTEAYRILSDAGRRAEYDRAFAEAGAAPRRRAAEPVPAQRQGIAGARSTAGVHHRRPQQDAARRGRRSSSRSARAGDEFVRKATLSRLRQALEAVGGGYDESQLRGFDLALVPKKKLFGRNKNPKLLARFVARLDRERWPTRGRRR